MTTNINEIKEVVKLHTIVPFKTENIACQDNTLIINERYRVQDTQKLMNTIGIRSNLSKEIFAKPEANWGAIQTALNQIDKNKRFAGIVNSGNDLVTLIDSRHSEPTQLNYDERLDNLLNAISDSNEFDLKDITFDSNSCNVLVNTTNHSEIECGDGDNWKFGTTTTVNHNSQQFANYFLRLICTNGMTTKEKMAYRLATVCKNIGKQFLKFASNTAFMNLIKPRVAKLRNSRASLYEVNSIADNLTKEEKMKFMPEYFDIEHDFKENGHDIQKMGSKRQKLVYTDQNLYDVFNLATSLATHQKDVLSQGTRMQLNKAASDIFSAGPNLAFDNILDIYKK